MQSSPCSTLAPTIKVNEDRYGITRTGIFVSVSPNSSPEERRIQASFYKLANLHIEPLNNKADDTWNHLALHPDHIGPC